MRRMPSAIVRIAAFTCCFLCIRLSIIDKSCSELLNRFCWYTTITVEKYPTSVGCFFMKMAVLSRRVEKNRWRPIRRQKNVGAVLEFHTVFEVQPVPVENTGFWFQGNITSPMEMYPQCIPRNSSSLVGLCSVFRRCAAGRLNAEHVEISTKSSNIKGPGSCLPGPILGADGGSRTPNLLVTNEMLCH